ncbi:MAG: cellulose biosynthesis protein BcsG [Pseudoalteromonas prydzensis]|uniref:Cellulose biosynthesis protein BcsG n=1 Tax=Pseudoalteromonas prydzensis TaxID=182141 RepID=A0ABR9FH61_9GAMM|nr:cellulose biosynthesis protein BcsG [Pseudoalteromonas prydzensis]MBE0456152.1 cellulose biosynthesis protein BcsG [Pseudoalteromonas prydzensis]
MKLSGLGVWNLYFLAKFALYLRGDISFDWLSNAAFFAFLLLSSDSRIVMRIKNGLSVVLAIALLYHDSWLPPISRLLKQATNLQEFSFDYFLEIVARMVSIDLLLGVFVLSLVYWYSVKWLRYTSITVLGFAYVYWFSTTPVAAVDASLPTVASNKVTSQVVPVNITQSELAGTPDQQLKMFYQQQARLKTQFADTFQGEQFDVVVLNICSLANADLNAIGVKANELFKNFDILFSDFNSATSYSGPAAIRLLRASCGQTDQDSLFKPVDEQCHLFNNLTKLGYSNSVAMNHDGHFDDFIGLLNQHGGVSAPKFDFSGLSPMQYGFDGKPIYSDSEVLLDWLNKQPNNSQPRALYYNSISLHDGNQLAGRGRMNSLQSYPTRQQQLFNDINRFIDELENQGRNVLLVVVPEHGAALAGDKLQFAGLREIPSPSIVSVPTAVKFIGPNVKNRELIEVTDTVSYFSLSELINNAVKSDVFSGTTAVDRLLGNTRSITKVAENQDTVMMYIKGEPYIQLDGGEWTRYPSN